MAKKLTSAVVTLVLIIARIQFKADPRKVVYLVRSSNGVDQYEVHMFEGKACSCSCPSRKPCKHMKHAEAKEAERQSFQVEAKALAEAREAGQPITLQGSTWEVIGAERIRATLIKWVFGGLNEFTLAVLNRHPEASWWIEQDKRHLQFAEMLIAEYEAARQEVSAESVKAREESAEYLAKIEQEVLASIEAEKAKAPIAEVAPVTPHDFFLSIACKEQRASAFEDLKARYDVRNTNPSTVATNMVIESKRRQEATLAGTTRAFSLFR